MSLTQSHTIFRYISEPSFVISVLKVEVLKKKPNEKTLLVTKIQKKNNKENP
jgi:hypothetical protein